MFGTHDLFLFVISCLLLTITPGQDTMYILGKSISQGRRAGGVSVAGIMCGILLHTTFAALGLSVILATSSLTFNFIKYAGAAYLIWIGISMLCDRKKVEHVKALEEKSLKFWIIYRQALLTNLLNPKVSLFFLSFLPQFVDPTYEFTFTPFILLGLILFGIGAIWCLLLVYTSSWLAVKFRSKFFFGNWLKKISGVMFIGFGVKLALAQRN